MFVCIVLEDSGGGVLLYNTRLNLFTVIAAVNVIGSLLMVVDGVSLSLVFVNTNRTFW